MPRLFKNVGYEQYFQNEKESSKTINYLVNTTKDIIKGYQYTYFQHSNGNIETDLCGIPDGKVLDVKSVNVHCSNMVSWMLKIKTLLNLDYDDYSCVACSQLDGTGLFAGTIILPDVLPRISENMTFEAQIAGFPLWIDFFATEEETVKCFKDGIGIANGTIWPVRYLKYLFTKDKTEEETKQVCSKDLKHKINLVRATIKSAQLVWDDKFYMVYVDTTFGELPLYFPKEMANGHVPVVGEEIVSDVIIQLDVGILEREGAKYDDESLYELFLDAIETSGGTRLNNALADNCKYNSEWASTDYSFYDNKKDIIKRMDDIIVARKNYDDMRVGGKITKVIGFKDDTIDHKFNIGDKCILFSNYVDKCWECAFFLKLKNEKIKEIYITTDSNYIFDVNKQKNNNDTTEKV